MAPVTVFERERYRGVADIENFFVLVRECHGAFFA